MVSRFIGKVLKLHEQGLSPDEILETLNENYNPKNKKHTKIYPDNVHSAIRLIKMGAYK